MIAVHLKDLKFHAQHGLYTGEEKTGSPFEVNLSVWYNPGGTVTSLDHTINYVELFHIVKQHMQERTGLLEIIAENICNAIKDRFPVISEIKLELYKCSPPIENFQGKTGITMQKTY